MTLENIINGFKRIAVTGLLGLSMLYTPACGEPEGNGSSGGCVSNDECHAPRVCYRGECVDEEDVPENNDGNNVVNNNNSNNGNNGSVVDDNTAVVSCKNPDSEEGLRDIYLLDLTDNELTRITSGSDEGFDDIHAVISPDRKIVTFTRAETSGRRNRVVYSLNLEDGIVTPFDSFSEDCVYSRWSETGELGISCYGFGDYDTLHVLDITTGEVVGTTSISYLSFDWSPDGEKIIFDSDEGFIIKNLSNDSRYVIRNTPYSGCTDLSWSEYGIAFDCIDNEDESFLHIMEPDGGNIRQWTELNNHRDESPSWSPDGSKIIFSRFGALEEGIYILNLQGEQVEEVPLQLKCSLPFWRY